MDAGFAIPSSSTPRQRFAAFALVLCVYLLLVIVFGAWVRISGSGAGCGDHWPTCNGQVVPRSPSAATIIEYSHRMSSGLLGLFTLALPLWAWRVFPARHPVRRWSALVLVFVVLEAGIGAGLVLGRLVALDASVARAIAVALHLGNTLLLTGSAALTVAWARRAETQPVAGRQGPQRAEAWLLGVLLVSLALVASSGAVTALGDTLFPVRALDGALSPPSDHFLVQLRVVHPLFACGVVCFALLLGRHFAGAAATRVWALALSGLAALQLVAGALNIGLNAPGWLQLLHLLGAQLTWISAVLLTWSWRRAQLGHAGGISLACRLGSGATFAIGAAFGIGVVVGTAPSASAAPVVQPRIVQRYPHDVTAFTEGLLLRNGELLESTGLLGASSLRRVALASGKVLDRVALPDSEFGEGLALAGERLIQLTWQNGVAHVYDATTLRAVERFDYSGEGWGLCHDGTRLIMSDGSDQLFFRDPRTFELQGSVSVRDEGNPVTNLNELECVGGEVFANVWLSDVIVRIEVASGRVLTAIDATALRAVDAAPGADVLNGIAFDQASGHFLLTGKYWPSLFEVELPLPSLQPTSNPVKSAPKHESCEMSPQPMSPQPRRTALLLAGLAGLAAICLRR